MIGATLGGTALSLAAISFLAATDPKRRSAFRLPPVVVRAPRLAWAAVLVSGVAVAVLEGAGGFLVGFGAVTVAGWGVASIPPEGVDPLRRRMADGAAALSRRAEAGIAGSALAWAGSRRFARRCRRARGTPRPAGSRRSRHGSLEAEVVRLRRAAADDDGRDDANVVELLLPARC
jgi:hypothetical protein